MQVSQALHFAIELYDSLDYLLVMDYEDDITLYDDITQPGTVSYYQMKTKDDSISINTALTEDWISKLYSHFKDPDLFVRELALITNCPIKLVNQTTLVSADKTPFSSFNADSVSKIKKDIANKHHISVDEVDLSRMFHLRTTLSIDRHKDIVEKEATDFLFERFPQIKVQTIKTIFAAVIDILSKKQAYERLPDCAEFPEIQKKKGFSRDTFKRIINYSIRINIPEFEEVKRTGLIPEDCVERAALAYTQILADNNLNIDSFCRTFSSLENVLNSISPCENETNWSFFSRCKCQYENDAPMSAFLYSDSLYLEVLSICIMISKNGGAI